MAGAAGIGVLLGEILMLLGKLRVAHRMHSMRSFKSHTEIARMAGVALNDGSGMALQPLRRLVVVGQCIGVGPDRMGAAVAAFTEESAVALAAAIITATQAE